MKILNVVYSLAKGGTERAAQNFAFGYASIGCDSRVLFTRVDGLRRQYIEDKGIPLYSLDNEKDCEVIKKWGPDVVHLHSHGIHVDEFEKIRSLLPNSKYVETNVFSRPSPWAKSIDISYQLSQWCLWLFENRLGQKYRSAIIPYPVDTSSFARVSDQRRQEFRAKYGLKDSDLVLGRIGQNFRGKWSPILLDVFEELRESNPKIKLLVVNPPSSIIERVLESPYQSDVIHIETIRGDEALAACYSSIDVFLLIAEQGESFGMVLAESLLCETPVVTLATPWGDNSQGEVIGNDVGGFVAANKNELGRLVKNLVDDQSVRKEMGRNGRERIIKLFDSKIVAKKSVNVIEGNKVNVVAPNPLRLMMGSEGSIGLLSKIILKKERFFFLLIYTLRYRSFYHLSIKVLSMFKNHILKLAGMRTT